MWSDLKLLLMRKIKASNEKWSILCDYFGESIWFSVVGPEMEVGAKIREVVSYWPSADHNGLTAPGLGVGLPCWLLLRLWVRVLF